MEGTVFSIEEFSVYDGPGIRTTVFLKGCPLRCSWCHNPEGQEKQSKILRSPNGCLGCGACEKYADDRGFTEKSMENCPRQLLRICGEQFTPEDLTAKLLDNKRLLDGVTFSGGEPLQQPVFLLECLKLLEGRLHRAVQTSGFASGAVFENILKNTDYVLFDLKLMDEAEHVYHTGQSNRPILENFEVLVRSGVAFVPRVPLIPGVTDTEKNITAIAAHLRDRGITYAELLPYNQMAGSKYKLAGMTYSPKFDESVPCRHRQDIFERFGIMVKVY